MSGSSSETIGYYRKSERVTRVCIAPPLSLQRLRSFQGGERECLNSYSLYYLYRGGGAVQKSVEKTVVPVRFSKSQIDKIDKTVKRLGMKSRSDLIREATDKYIREAGSLKVIEIRDNVSLQKAKTEILAYLRLHKEAETFDIANDLRLDLDLTVKALKELWEERKVG
jgi:Arc/MetJ-type ribon-helix-helix transcriptional regulator